MKRIGFLVALMAATLSAGLVVGIPVLSALDGDKKADEKETTLTVEGMT